MTRSAIKSVRVFSMKPRIFTPLGPFAKTRAVTNASPDFFHRPGLFNAIALSEERRARVVHGMSTILSLP
jgi:hypothetical protein